MIPKTKKNAINDIEIMMYLALGVKHLRLMVLLISLSLMCGLTYYTFARPVYLSKALVRCQVVKRQETTEKIYKDSAPRAIMKALKSPVLIQRAAKSLGVHASSLEIELRYLKLVKFGFDADYNVTIETYPYSLEWATNFPGALVSEFLIYRADKRREMREAAIQQFTNDMADLDLRMKQVAIDKFGFRITNEITRIMIDFEQLKQVPQDLAITENQISVMEGIREKLRSDDFNVVQKLSLVASMDKELQAQVGDVIPAKDENHPQIVVVPSAITPDSPRPWETFDKEKMRLDNAYNDLSRTYLPGHPKMREIKKQLDVVNKQLVVELQVATNRFEYQYAELLDKKDSLEKKRPLFEKTKLEYETAVKKYARYDSSVVNWAQIHDKLNKSLLEIDYADDKEYAEIKYMGLTEWHDEPVSPYKLKLFLYSLIIGLALAIAIPFLLEYVDSRVSDMNQVEEALHIRGLGVVPKITEAPIDSLILNPPDDKLDHHLQENFRLIRTNLIMNSDSPAMPQVILITSSMPQEGKTVVSANLAISFAKKGERTLLIDADLRRGRVHRLFACQNRPGLSEVLSENRPLEDAVRTDIHENLDVMTCGKHLHWASELLDSAAFPKFMEELRRKYQRIIIDTPPVLGLSETSILQRSADGVLLVIWSDYTPLHNAKAAITALATNGAKFCGFVMNRLDFSTLTNRYKYFYYSPYYYGSYKALETPPTAPAAPAA